MTIDSSILTQKNVMRSFPKVELHRHLEGTFALNTLFRISEKNKVGRSSDFAEFKKQVQFPRDSKPDFLEFLSKFYNDWYRSHEDVYDIVHDSVREMTTDGIFYIELRFSPEHFALHNDFDREEITRLVIKAANEAAKEADIHIRYLITFNRSKQDQYEMIELYERIHALNIPEIVGIDLAGDETNYPPEMFEKFFGRIKKDGFYKVTIHAGEVSPAQQIWYAVQNLHADRIGHGVAAVHDEELQKELAKRDVVLEQCITSNYQTGSWEDEKNHPLGLLYRNNVPVTINSDDPTIQDTDLTDDYIKAVKYFDLGFDDLVRMNHTAIRSSFLPEAEKKALLKEYNSRIDQFIADHS